MHQSRLHQTICDDAFIFREIRLEISHESSLDVNSYLLFKKKGQNLKLSESAANSRWRFMGNPL